MVIPFQPAVKDEDANAANRYIPPWMYQYYQSEELM
jgi:hypothetical protein